MSIHYIKYFDTPAPKATETDADAGEAVATKSAAIETSQRIEIDSESDSGLKYLPQRTLNIKSTPSPVSQSLQNERIQNWVATAAVDALPPPENSSNEGAGWQTVKPKRKTDDTLRSSQTRHSKTAPVARGGPSQAARGQDVASLQELTETFPERFSMARQPFPSDHSMTTAPCAIREYFQAAANRGDPSKRWLAASEVPTSIEVMQANNEESCPVNKINAAWSDKETYLSAHYELLREDCVYPMRLLIHQVREHPEEPEAYFSGSIGIYERTRIVGVVCDIRGVAVKVAFSLARAGKRVHWQQSKRLISGSLVALTPAKDMFRKKCVLATVAARPLCGLEENPPKLDLYFARADELEIDPGVEWVMIEERSAYFEASRHIMKALQKMSGEGDRFPLHEHLINVEREIQPPEYLVQHPMVNMSKAFEATENESYENINILEAWPKAAKTTLDKSQLKALKTILTKSLAIVQGPPGTGKTHVSVVALKVMLDNWKTGDTPIVVSCQTNHALDQLLRHVAVFEPNFARLGGRSKDRGVVQERTLFNLRMASNSKPGGSYRIDAKRMKSLSEDVEAVLSPLRIDSDALLDPEVLKRLEVITDKQCQSLLDGDQAYVNTKQEEERPLHWWLGSSLIMVKCTLEPDEFGYEYEEADLEFEQIQELEAEAHAQDDEQSESLRGPFFSLVDKFTGKKRAVLTETECKSLLRHQNMWDISPRSRGAVYCYLQRQAKAKMLEAFRSLAQQYDRVARERSIGKLERDFQIVKDMKLVGLTTTGLSKYRPLISALEPKIVLIEEAAETIEAPVTVSLVPSVEHLILIGDHLQLRPQCSNKFLQGEPFNLDISLFERMVINDVEFSVLGKQRRMKPEIRRLLEPIYKDTIRDHPLVKDLEYRPPVPGMGNVNSFFFTHSMPEALDDNNSAFNQHEVDMVVGFFDYLVLNGTEADKITVLTFYNGQRKAITRALHKRPNLKGGSYNVATVDSYQGEENDIILLSLVRSNDRNSIGFLSVQNRVCVSLSRAKRGFYLFGNAEMLCVENHVWERVVSIMWGKLGETIQIPPERRISHTLTLVCENHGRKTFIDEADDFDKIPGGGCERKCKGLLKCGHPCGLTCHPFDHDRVACMKPCERSLECGHKCHLTCGEPCHCDLCNRDEDDSDNEPLTSVEMPIRTLAKGATSANPVARQTLGYGAGNTAGANSGSKGFHSGVQKDMSTMKHELHHQRLFLQEQKRRRALQSATPATGFPPLGEMGDLSISFPPLTTSSNKSSGKPPITAHRPSSGVTTHTRKTPVQDHRLLQRSGLPKEVFDKNLVAVGRPNVAVAPAGAEQLLIDLS